ncbi:SirB2 family protein [Oleiphilus messinensis]|nr:SirB2 family protein [Oleiphilus messinensis]
MTYYLLIKQVHIICVIATLILFSFRGILMMLNSRLLHTRLIRVLPHIVDTVLLVSAILLTLQIHQYPFVNDWLTAKLIALLAYIAVGTFALKRGKTKSLRILLFFIALAIFFYILAVARTHSTLIPF